MIIFPPKFGVFIPSRKHIHNSKTPILCAINFTFDYKAGRGRPRKKRIREKRRTSNYTPCQIGVYNKSIWVGMERVICYYVKALRRQPKDRLSQISSNFFVRVCYFYFESALLVLLRQLWLTIEWGEIRVLKNLTTHHSSQHAADLQGSRLCAHRSFSRT